MSTYIVLRGHELFSHFLLNVGVYQISESYFESQIKHKSISNISRREKQNIFYTLEMSTLRYFVCILWRNIFAGKLRSGNSKAEEFE